MNRIDLCILTIFFYGTTIFAENSEIDVDNEFRPDQSVINFSLYSIALKSFIYFFSITSNFKHEVMKIIHTIDKDILIYIGSQ